MSEQTFIAYIGGPELHDAVILTVEQSDTTVNITIQTADQNQQTITFTGVQTIKMNQAEGMVLYAIAELTAEFPLRHFIFSNWDETSPAYLEITALNFSIMP